MDEEWAEDGDAVFSVDLGDPPPPRAETAPAPERRAGPPPVDRRWASRASFGENAGSAPFVEPMVSPPHVSPQPAGFPIVQAPVVAAPPAPSGDYLGLAILVVIGGAIGGGALGGLSGAGAGALFGGAAINAVRSVQNLLKGPGSDKEAIVSGTFAVGGAAAAIYLLFRANKAKAHEGDRFESNASESSEESTGDEE